MEGCIPGVKVLSHSKSSFYSTKTRISEELYYQEVLSYNNKDVNDIAKQRSDNYKTMDIELLIWFLTKERWGKVGAPGEESRRKPNLRLACGMI